MCGILHVQQQHKQQTEPERDISNGFCGYSTPRLLRRNVTPITFSENARFHFHTDFNETY